MDEHAINISHFLPEVKQIHLYPDKTRNFIIQRIIRKNVHKGHSFRLCIEFYPIPCYNGLRSIVIYTTCLLPIISQDLIKAVIPILKKIFGKLFSPELSFKARVFDLLALTGFLVSFSVFLISLLNGTSLINSGVLLSSAVLSLILLIYSSVTGNYRICYIITIIFLFMLLFPIMFFTAGGFKSGMPCFFVFATTFTLFMLGGKTGIEFSSAELLIYVACCIIACERPDLVTHFPDDKAIMIDVITGFGVSSAALGAAMFFQLKMYSDQQKKLETAMTEATQSSKAKGIFLANMSHEIRTPINVMLGMSELINRSQNPEEIHEFTSVIQSSGGHLLSIINNILDVTQIESGKIVTSLKPYRTDSLLSELVTMGSELCARKGLAFETDISPDMMSMLEGDKNHLRQLVTNFISNAVKYTETGSIRLSAETTAEDDTRALLRITVSDTGIGIPEKELEHIFEIFRRGKNAIESAVEGTGLGLAISKDLADSMGGKLIAESRENEGSTFGIEVVQTIFDSSPVGKITLTIDERTCSDSFIAPECRILAVDDNAENLRVIKMLLERTMITVDTAPDGITASEMTQKNDYDLIFLDYMMPVTDGIETLRIMRGNGLSENIPVVALTAEALSGSEDKFISAGFTCYLSKPVSCHELEKVLINLLPAGKVTLSGASEKKISDESFEKLSAGLKKYDIDLEAGISYLSGNITRFCALAEIFADGYDSTSEKVRRMFAEHDDSLVYEVHSLKSAAKGIGAASLYELASELEKRSNSGDTEYVANSEKLLMFEWKRAACGMRYLLSEASEFNDDKKDECISGSDLEVQIQKGLEEHIWLDTQNALRQLIEKETDSKRIQELTYIAEFVDELDFVSAQALFGKMRRNDDG